MLDLETDPLKPVAQVNKCKREELETVSRLHPIGLLDKGRHYTLFLCVGKAE